MGSMRVSPPNGLRDRPERDIQLSPRRPRAQDEGDSRTLPSISDLLPEMNASNGHHGPPPSHRGPERSPPYRYRVSPPPSSSRPSPTNSSFSDRYHNPARRDDHPLPYHSGPPADRDIPSASTPSWPERRPLSTVTSGPPYTSQSYSTSHPHAYAPSGPGTPGVRPREDDYHTSLPPPPPHYGHNSARDPAPYARPRDPVYDDGRHESARWHETARPQYPSYPPPSREPAPGSYDPRAGQPPSHGPPGYPQSDSYGHPYPHLPPGGYDTRDEPPRKRRGNLPRWITDLLKAWFLEHIAHPYPSEQEKNELCIQTGCSMTQISNWFINARRRRTPELTRQAEAERRLRDHAGRSGSNSE